MSEPVDELVDGFTRLRLDFGYDGTDFYGWSKQPDLRTIQGEYIKALTLIFGEDDNGFGLRVAGRTDAGVHAVGCVLHMDLSDAQMKRLGRNDSMEDIAYKLNNLLPIDIRVNKVSIAPAGFDARFSPIYRRYEYRITDASSIRDPRTRHYTLWMDDVLDVERMNEAAQSLLGLHDWTTYCKPREGATRVRDLQKFDWHRDENGVLVASIQADAFCYNMVRNLVGVCVAVGRGRLEPGDAVTLRDQRVRTAAFAVLPPQGLTLSEVGYPDAAELAIRAEQARRRRDPV